MRNSHHFTENIQVNAFSTPTGKQNQPEIQSLILSLRKLCGVVRENHLKMARQDIMSKKDRQDLIGSKKDKHETMGSKDVIDVMGKNKEKHG